MLITRTDLVEWFKSESTFTQYSQGDETAVTTAISRASKKIIAALRRSGRYQETAIDALNADTAPDDVKGWACSLAADELSKSDAGRPPSLNDARDDAAQHVKFVATGAYIVDGIERVKRSRVRGASPSRFYFQDED